MFKKLYTFHQIGETKRLIFFDGDDFSGVQNYLQIGNRKIEKEGDDSNLVARVMWMAVEVDQCSAGEARDSGWHAAQEARIEMGESKKLKSV